jgi:hypothetical protein
LLLLGCSILALGGVYRLEKAKQNQWQKRFGKGTYAPMLAFVTGWLAIVYGFFFLFPALGS